MRQMTFSWWRQARETPGANVTSSATLLPFYSLTLSLCGPGPRVLVPCLPFLLGSPDRTWKSSCGGRRGRWCAIPGPCPQVGEMFGLGLAFKGWNLGCLLLRRQGEGEPEHIPRQHR